MSKEKLVRLVEALLFGALVPIERTARALGLSVECRIEIAIDDGDVQAADIGTVNFKAKGAA